MSYENFVTSVESPDGRDNDLGSGAFSRFQFMPATAAALAQRTQWGRGLTPATVKAAVMSTPGRDKELFDLYNADSYNALGQAGIPKSNTSMLALHRFGQGGGVSLLQAPATMSVADWVKSVNWGPGVAPEAVIRQNRLDRYGNVGQLRDGFLGGKTSAPVAEAFADATPPAPQQTALLEPPQQQPSQALAASLLADAFSVPDVPDRRKKQRQRVLFV